MRKVARQNAYFEASPRPDPVPATSSDAVLPFVLANLAYVLATEHCIFLALRDLPKTALCKYGPSHLSGQLKHLFWLCVYARLHLKVLLSSHERFSCLYSSDDRRSLSSASWSSAEVDR